MNISGRGGLGCKTCPISDCDAQYRGSRCAALRGKYNLGDPATMAEKFKSMDDKMLASLFAGFCSVADCTTNKRGGTLHCPLYGRCPGRPALSDWEKYMLSPASKEEAPDEE